MARTYWLDLFTVETWQEFLDHGGHISGFSEMRLATVKKMRPGDYLLCYLTRASRWVGVLEVTGEGYSDDTPIWKSQTFPSRVPVEVVVALAPEQGVPVLSMRDQLTVFQGLENPNRWSGPFRGSPAKWKQTDGEAVLHAVSEAKANPIDRPLPRLRKNVTRPIVGGDGRGQLVLPDDEDDIESAAEETSGSVHSEIQYLLLRLGADMGFDVHVARNDQGRTWNGQRLGDVPRRRETLPQQFDPYTNQTVELIDVLWLEGNAIVAAFEIESTTSIYSGLLRMSDLLSQQPNISVPLFLVAPDEWRPKVIKQVNRPTFDKMKPPLVDVCRYISFENLREQLAVARAFIGQVPGSGVALRCPW